MPSFERIRYRRHDTTVFLYAFDLIELNGDDLRREFITLLGGAGYATSVAASCAADGEKPKSHTGRVPLFIQGDDLANSRGISVATRVSPKP